MKGIREEVLASKDLADLFPAVEAAARKAGARRVILKVTTAEGNRIEMDYDSRRDPDARKRDAINREAGGER
jgi:hypothetical protein